MISEPTWRAAGDAIEAREIDFIRVKGKVLPTRIYELVAAKASSRRNSKTSTPPLPRRWLPTGRSAGTRRWRIPEGVAHHPHGRPGAGVHQTLRNPAHSPVAS